MIFKQQWEGLRIGEDIPFPVTVPGDIQADYAEAHHFGDVNYGENWAKFKVLEDDTWLYRTHVVCEKKEGERVFFVTEGIEYAYEVFLNGKKLLEHEGMFSKTECDITDELASGDLLEIKILPHPKRPGAHEDRQQADRCCKPPVGYLWDWHPRLPVSGLWEETYIETRCADSITDAEVFYTLDEDLKGADIRFEIACGGNCEITFTSPDGKVVYQGNERQFRIEDVKLWWCNGQGEANLYRWCVRSASDSKCGSVGFRRIKLIMNGGAWGKPLGFPKSRSTPPITVELNGRAIFAKGSNWVTPDIFTGRVTRADYDARILPAKEAGMNIFRCWGGANVDKEAFFDLCDEYGIMVWQEFPLACNNYVGTPHYLKILEQEAVAIIERLRRHACHIIWCGGNELFNSWSGMTDQSHALRLLNKLTYEHDFEKPFLATSPLMGMMHGHYHFYDPKTDRYVFECFNEAEGTAYTEFGVPSIASLEQLKKAIPAEELYKPEAAGSWKSHMAFGAWAPESWFCRNILDAVFGPQDSLEDYIEVSNWAQCIGYKHIFEEARRQKPACSMAINWCYNEPWINAAGNNLLAYPAIKKPSYHAVKDALRSTLPSARMKTFAYRAGETFKAELWLLNDAPEAVSATVSAYLIADGEKRHIMDWHTGEVAANTNKRGHMLQVQLPDTTTQKFILRLESEYGSSEYPLLLRGRGRLAETRQMNV